VLNSSAMSSNTNTPYLAPLSSQTLLPPLPSPLAANPPLEPLDDIPPLSLEVLSNHDDKVESLRLVADSIAQQRQQAARSLVFHPFPLAGLVAVLGLVYQYSYAQKKDLGMSITLVCGVIMSYLMGIRYWTMGYIRLAEELNWSWLSGEDGEEDTVLGTKFGDEIIGTVVLRLESSPTSNGKRKSRSSNLRGGKGVIRAWTTTLKYRHQGVGTDMLHEAVKITREKCGKDAEVGFARQHANSKMIMPDIFNGPFRKSERKAAKTLENVLKDWEASKKKR
jgi:hypothetical protein